MNYTILRDGEQYGPYTLGDLQRYVASGEILLTDIAFSEGMSEQVAVSQIVGTIAVPPPPAIPLPLDPALLYPNPPNLPWVALLAISTLICGPFALVWCLVLGSWLRKVNPNSKALFYYIGEIVSWVLFMVCAANSDKSKIAVACMILFLVGAIVLRIVDRFVFRSEMQAHYTHVEGIPLSLSGPMTFFFGSFYFQYHINQIVERKTMSRMTTYSQGTYPQ